MYVMISATVYMQHKLYYTLRNHTVLNIVVNEISIPSVLHNIIVHNWYMVYIKGIGKGYNTDP